MSESENAKKKRSTRDQRLVESGIYQLESNLFDVKVRKRIQGKQYTRYQRKVRFLSKARETRNKFVTELENLSDEILNGNCDWAKAKTDYFEFREKDPEISAKTSANQKLVVNKHTESWNEMRLSEFRQEFIINDLKVKLAGYPKSSVKAILKHIRAVFEFYLNKAKSPMNHNPCKGIQPWGTVKNEPIGGIPKMNKEEIKKLLDYTRETDSEWHLTFLTAYPTGMRSGELWALKWEDISPDFSSLTVKRSYCFHSKKEKSPKNGRSRKVPINARLAKAFKEEKLKSESSYVLPHHPEWADGKIAGVLKQIQEKLNITKTSFHSIRASCITHMLMSGVVSVAVMSMVGHSSLKTTQLYVRRLDEEDLVSKITDGLLEEDAKVISFQKKSAKR